MPYLALEVFKILSLNNSILILEEIFLALKYNNLDVYVIVGMVFGYGCLTDLRIDAYMFCWTMT